MTDERDSDDTKICGKKIKIGAKLSIAKLCELHFEFVKSHTINSEKGGNYSSLSGDDYSSLSGGDYSSLSSGDYSSLSGRGTAIGGKDSIIVVRGNNIKAKGGIGSVIVIVNEKKDNHNIAEWKAGVIDGEMLKADTWYALKGGEFIEVIE